MICSDCGSLVTPVNSMTVNCPKCGPIYTGIVAVMPKQLFADDPAMAEALMMALEPVAVTEIRRLGQGLMHLLYNAIVDPATEWDKAIFDHAIEEAMRGEK